LAKQGKLSDAITCFHKAIARDARLSQAYASLGDALRDQKKVKEAIDAYRHAARIDPKRAIYFLQLGNVLFGQNEPLEATECYKTVVALEPKMPAAHRNLGRALEAQGKLDDAIAAFRRAKELDPDNARGRTELAKALSDRAWELADHPDPGADTKRAIAAATDALRSDPNSARVGLFLGWVQYRAGNWQGSLEALERSCALADGGDWGQWIVMSLAHAKLAADTTLPATERSRHKAEARRRYDAAAMQIDHWGSGTNRTMQDARAFRVEAAAELGLPPPSERPSAPAVPGSPH
jgi:tetratricopeptide (TPR) repeat protein